MKQIVIGNFRVDTVRCEVHRDIDIVSLEPKVMQVLLCLAKHQGEVVSYQTLLDEVWPNTVVEANALQRCIGQLRKAFQDDAKKQRAIATYPKNGYSLLLEVEWSSPAIPSKRPSLAIYAIIVSIAVLIGFLFLLDQPLQSPSPAQENMFELTEVAKELESLPVDFYAVYSPDGLYVVYSRPIENESSLRNLWLQNLSNNKETALSSDPGRLEDIAWSPDSQSLVYVKSVCGDENCQQAKCSALFLLTAPLAENVSHQAEQLIDCISSRLHSPQWTHDNTLVLIEDNNGLDSIIKYNLELASSEILFQQKGQLPQHLAYSKATENLAITMLDDEGQFLIIFSLATNEWVRINPDLPEITMNQPWYPIWNLQNNSLLISSTEGIFNIELDGSVSIQNSAFIPAIN